MNDFRRYVLVIAIYFNARGFAFVIFESSLSPVDWGVKEVRGDRKHARCLVKIVAILDQYQPDVLVLQDTSPRGTLRARRITKLNSAIAELATGRGMALYAYSRADIWNAFRDVGVSNKHDPLWWLPLTFLLLNALSHPLASHGKAKMHAWASSRRLH